MTVTGVTGLSFDRTVARQDVHRWALNEVFLTDVRPSGDGEYTAAAQLPSSHTYFGDHEPPVPVDSMLVMECVRQAATYIAHRHLEVPRDSMFLVADWSLSLEPAAGSGDTGAVPGPATDPAAGRLVMVIKVRPQIRSATVRGAHFSGSLELDGVRIGSIGITARYTPAEEADLVRCYHRRDAPPTTPSLPSVPPGARLAPALAGRTRAANVVLFDAVTGGSEFAAVLGTEPSHRSYYDHPQDHYPAMILLEAARQAAIAHTGPAARISAYQARFMRFAELDAAVTIRASTTPEPATPDSGRAGEPGGGPDRSRVTVTFAQNGTVLAEVDIVLSVPPAAGGRPGVTS